MRAALIEGPGRLVVREVHAPVPSGPAADYQADCELVAGAVCSGTDQHLVGGTFPWPPSYPAILGHESIGRVCRVGPRVRHLQVGDLVTRVGAPPSPHGDYHASWGGFAERGIAHDHRAMREDGLPEALWGPHRINQPLPAWVDAIDATLMITWRETLSYLRRRGFRAGMSLLVVGSGGNGLAFVAHARNDGANQVTMIGSAPREGSARAVGATDYLDHRGRDPFTAARRLRPEGYDLVIDALGRAGIWHQALPLVRPGGTYAVYGIDDHSQAVPTTAPSGITVFDSGDYDEAETHDAVLARMADGSLRAADWLGGDRYRLDDIGEALAAVQDRRAIKALVQLQ